MPLTSKKKCHYKNQLRKSNGRFGNSKKFKEDFGAKENFGVEKVLGEDLVAGEWGMRRTVVGKMRIWMRIG